MPGLLGECNDFVRTGQAGFDSRLGLILTHGLDQTLALKTVTFLSFKIQNCSF